MAQILGPWEIYPNPNRAYVVKSHPVLGPLRRESASVFVGIYFAEPSVGIPNRGPTRSWRL